MKRERPLKQEFIIELDNQQLHDVMHQCLRRDAEAWSLLVWFVRPPLWGVTNFWTRWYGLRGWNVVDEITTDVISRLPDRMGGALRAYCKRRHGAHLEVDVPSFKR
jgi:hypothetical protein